MEANEKKYFLKHEVMEEFVPEDPEDHYGPSFNQQFWHSFECIKKEVVDDLDDLTTKFARDSSIKNEEIIQSEESFKNIEADVKKHSPKCEIEKVLFTEKSSLNPQFSYNFDCFKKEENEINEAVNDVSSEFPHYSNIKNEEVVDEKNSYYNECEMIRKSEFPIVLLKKLWIRVCDKVSVTVNGDDYKINISKCDDKGAKIEETLVAKEFPGNVLSLKQNNNKRVKGERNFTNLSTNPNLSGKKPSKKKESVNLKKNIYTVNDFHVRGKNFERLSTEVKIKVKEYECCKCHYKTSVRSNFQRHLKSHDKTVSSFKCSECDFTTKRKDNLKVHILCHFESQFKCCFCPYKTNDKRNFNRHIVIHSEKKLLKCWQCDFTTNYTYHLRNHEINHSDLKQFACSECSYKTNYKKNLVRHILDHSGTRAYKCDCCSYRTNDVSHLKRHRKARSH